MGAIKSSLNQEPELIIEKVIFDGSELISIKELKTDKGYGAIKWLCQGLGLSENQSKAQYIKIQGDPLLSKGVKNFSLLSQGGYQDTLCLEWDYIPIWLAKINAKIIKDLIIQKRLLKYQFKAKDILAAAFINPEKDEPQTEAEILLAAAQKLVKIEREQKAIKEGLKETNAKLDQVAIEQQKLLETRDRNMKRLFEVQRSQVLPLQRATRSLLNELVRVYAGATGISVPDVWNKCYQEFFYRYHINIKTCATNRGLANLDYVESIAHMEQLFAVASQILVIES